MAQASKKGAKSAKKTTAKAAPKTTKKAAAPKAKAPKTEPSLAFAEVPAPAAVPVQVPYPQSPVLDMTMAIVVLAVNLFFPGIGTIIAGIVGKQKLIGRGIAQLLLSLVFVGWIWALITSIQCLSNANASKSSA